MATGASRNHLTHLCQPSEPLLFPLFLLLKIVASNLPFKDLEDVLEISASNGQWNGSRVLLSNLRHSLTTVCEYHGDLRHVSKHWRLENGLFFLGFHGVANRQATEQQNGSQALLSSRRYSLTTVRQYHGALEHVSKHWSWRTDYSSSVFTAWRIGKQRMMKRQQSFTIKLTTQPDNRPSTSKSLGGRRHGLEAGERTILPRLSHLTIRQATDVGAAAERHSQA
jgi:hypothetical protein